MRERKRKHDDAHYPMQGKGRRASRTGDSVLAVLVPEVRVHYRATIVMSHISGKPYREAIPYCGNALAMPGIGEPANTSEDWSKVTCKLCLRYHKSASTVSGKDENGKG